LYAKTETLGRPSPVSAPVTCPVIVAPLSSDALIVTFVGAVTFTTSASE
jgi:hypothetical protein